MATILQGFARGWVGPLCAIDDLFVVPEHRRRGVGKALLAGAAAEAIGCGAPFLELTVREDNQPAIQLYQRIGFERVPAVAARQRPAEPPASAYGRHRRMPLPTVGAA